LLASKGTGRSPHDDTVGLLGLRLSGDRGVPVANRLAELGIDPTPLFAASSGILRLYADTLERPQPRR
jgi:hypothetical protein